MNERGDESPPAAWFRRRSIWCGIGSSRLGIHLSDNSVVGHVMAVESRTYKKARRHGPGGQVIVIAQLGRFAHVVSGQRKGDGPGRRKILALWGSIRANR